MRLRNPIPTVDIIIEFSHGIILIARKHPPSGWALPGGFIEYGESAEHAAMREAFEETGLEITDMRQFHVYSAPDRDPRHYTLTVVFVARAQGKPRAGDDAAHIDIFTENTLPLDIAFDHRQILEDFFSKKY
jgi:ADP-ribose pyrophosphatase YjhB (NUDIX family)